MPTDRLEVFIGPHGSHHGIGSSGYPVRELAQAMALVRGRRDPGQDAVIWVFPGTYRIGETLVLGPGIHTRRSQRSAAATWSSMDRSGSPAGRRSPSPTASSGPPPCPNAGSSVSTPTASAGIDRDSPGPANCGCGRRRASTSTADFDGTLFDGADRFVAALEDLPALADPAAVEVVVPHFWVQERMPIQSIDRTTGRVVSTRRSIFALRDDAAERFARFWLDNVAEAFGEVPGEWYLDRSGVVTGEPRLLYAPEPGESVEETVITVPAWSSSSGWRAARPPGPSFAVSGSRASLSRVPASPRRPRRVHPSECARTSFFRATSISPRPCRVPPKRRCGAVLGRPRLRVRGGWSAARGRVCDRARRRQPRQRHQRRRTVRPGRGRHPGVRARRRVLAPVLARQRSQRLRDPSGGRVYPNAVAVLFQHGADNVIAHNAIHDFFYTGISVGWSWDYVPQRLHGETTSPSITSMTSVRADSTTRARSTCWGSHPARVCAEIMSMTSAVATTAAGGSISTRAPRTSSSRAMWCTTAATRHST